MTLSDNSPEPAAIHVRGLTRTFDAVTAVDALDLAVPTGAVFGLLGPDGAGKSTLIRMLATVLAPDSGEADVFGHAVNKQPGAITGRIGYMSQQFSMYPDLTVAENLEFFARLRGVPKPLRRERAASLLTSMGMADFTSRQARKLSGGMKQKLMLASTLMHEPDLLLLDEPTTGVDPVSRREFWRILGDIHAQGKTVLVATPYMDEAERCTHVAFLDAGVVRHQGTPEALKASVPGTLVEVAAEDPRAALAALQGRPGIASTHLLGDTVRVLLHEGEPVDLDQWLADAGVAALARPIPMDMESVFAFLADARSSTGLPEEVPA
ncbi:MAG: ABC transporter ATP-binding protein [Propionibacteriaceae bacterium]|nr:ABC transporter ATP-binding protein [Propionibacteriaceae bacterium]